MPLGSKGFEKHPHISENLKGHANGHMSKMLTEFRFQSHCLEEILLGKLSE